MLSFLGQFLTLNEIAVMAMFGGFIFLLFRGVPVAMALVDPAYAEPGTELSVHVVGIERPAKVLAPSPYDPEGKAMRG